MGRKMKTEEDIASSIHVPPEQDDEAVIELAIRSWARVLATKKAARKMVADRTMTTFAKIHIAYVAAYGSGFSRGWRECEKRHDKPEPERDHDS